MKCYILWPISSAIGSAIAAVVISADGGTFPIGVAVAFAALSFILGVLVELWQRK